MRSNLRNCPSLTAPAVLLLLAALAAPAVGEEVKEPGLTEGVEEVTEPQTAVEEPQAGRPVGLGVTSYLLSDYIFRGINFSEYEREGREKPNHQLVTTMGVPLGEGGKYGTVGFDTFFEWYADQEKINPTTSDNTQEIDYTIWWSYDLERIATTATLGWTMFVFPNVQGVGDNDRTHEWFVRLEHNDAWMWRSVGYEGEDGILNPSFFLAHDMQLARGAWMEFGINHPFALTDNLVLTPSAIFAIDGSYLGPLLGTDDHDFRYAYTQLGLDLTYDMTSLLHLPEWAGTVAISGMLFYTCPTESAEHTGLEDQFWGGMALSWAW